MFFAKNAYLHVSFLQMEQRDTERLHSAMRMKKGEKQHKLSAIGFNRYTTT
jgi:hypothetical protein